MELTFGVPKKRHRRVEFRDDVPALRIEAYRGDKTSRRILINSLAMESLGIVAGEYVAIGFDSSNTAFIVGRQDEIPGAYKVNKVKPYLFTDGKMYAYLVDTYFDGNETIDHDIVLDMEAGQTSAEPIKLIFDENLVTEEKVQEIVREVIENPSTDTGEEIINEEVVENVKILDSIHTEVVVVEEPQIIEEVLSTTTEPSNDIFDFTSEYETKVENISNPDMEARLHDLI